MRKSILCFLALSAACGEGDRPGFVVIEDFSATAVAARCDPVELGLEAVVSELRLATDSTWTLLDEPGLQVLTFGDDLALRSRTPLAAEGPGAAPNPTSAGLLGDTAVVVLARGGLRLVVLSMAGRELDTAPLDFIPHAVEVTRSGAILVTPLPFGSKPPTLLLRYARGKWDTLDVPRRRYEDMTVNALGNTALVEALPSGGALVVHQYLEPRGYLVSESGAVEPLAVPTPGGTGDAITFLPRSPLTEDQFPLMLLPAMAMTVDPVTSEVYLLTRSGREVEGRPERAVLRLTRRLEFLQGYTLPVRAGTLVYLPRRGAALTADDEGRLHLCHLPRSSVEG